MSVAGGAVAVGVLGGCSSDPAIAVLKRDPMYRWTPTIKAKRSESVSEKGKPGEFKPSPFSSVSVRFAPVDGAHLVNQIEEEARAEMRRLAYADEIGGLCHELEGVKVCVGTGNLVRAAEAYAVLIIQTTDRP